MKNIMLVAAISLFIGIFIASKLFFGMIVIMSSFLLVLVLAFLNRHKLKTLKAILMLAIYLFGMFEYTSCYNHQSKLERYTDSNINIHGIITDNPITKTSYTELSVISTKVFDNGKIYNYREKLIVKYKGEKNFKFGDLVEINGTLIDIPNKRNFGDFDYKMYYKSKGINKNLEVLSIKLLEENKQSIIACILYNAKNKIKTIIFKAMPHREAAMIYGMLTGNKEEIDKDTMDAFKVSGIAHILSVSGLHVGFLVLLLGMLLKPLKMNIKNQSIITITVVFFYILMIGMPTPAVRAFIMLAVMLLGKVMNRQYNLLASVSFAAIIMLLINPLSIHSPGFIISFSCMYSIATLFEPINAYLANVPRLIRDSLSLSLAVWIGITPVMAWYFNYVSLISILLNLIAVPFAFAITSIGFIGVSIGTLFFYGSLYVFSIGYYLIRILLFITDKSVKLSFAGVLVPTLPLYVYALYYIGVVFLVGWFGSLHYKNYRRYYLLSGIIALVAGLVIYNIPTNMVINYFDVGQGDGACVITPTKKVILIDGGGSASEGQYYYDVGNKITVPVLLHQGVWKIDTIIASHAHEDHIEGLIAVVNTFKVDNIVFPKIDYENTDVSEVYYHLIKLCQLKGIKVHYLSKGDIIKITDTISMDVLWPDLEYDDLAINNLNNSSLVIELKYRNFNALFTGDVEEEVESVLEKVDLKAEIIKVPHHGSKTSSTEELLKKSKANYAIISVGKNNFGHPSKEVLERLNKLQIKVLRTDENGGVTVITNGKKMRVKSVK